MHIADSIRRNRQHSLSGTRLALEPPSRLRLPDSRRVFCLHEVNEWFQTYQDVILGVLLYEILGVLLYEQLAFV